MSEGENAVPKPAAEKFRILCGPRETGIVTSFFDITVPLGFNPAFMMQQVMGSGYFMPENFDVWIPAQMILGVHRIVDGKRPEEGKIIPFVVGGKDGPAAPSAS